MTLAPAAFPQVEYHEADHPAAAPDANPLAAVFRAMRGRWRLTGLAGLALGTALAVAGWSTGTQLYESQAILRVFPQEANILYRTGDDSVLKTFDSFVKAETSYVASNPVMIRAAEDLARDFPAQAADVSARDLAGSIEIKRSDSLIVLTTKSRDAAFAAGKLTAVVDAYMALKAEADAARSHVRLSELEQRETKLMADQAAIEKRILDVGGEYGLDALTKAHVEKVSQIDALAARIAEVDTTIAAMKAASGQASADMSDQEILRATLLDRALADLNFDRAKREAELATLLSRYHDDNPLVRDKRDEIAVIDKAMADRREQIKLLGQTGALTDTSSADPQQSLGEITALHDKLSAQLDQVRAEARELNGKRVELAALQDQAADVRGLLEDTRKALDVIRVEAGRALPGYTALMSPAVVPDTPAKDSRKMGAAAGLGGGIALAFALALGLGLASRRLRWSDDLAKGTVPVLRVLAGSGVTPPEADLIRTALQLHPLRAPRPSGTPPVIAVTRLDSGGAGDLALALAQSLARARVRTLLIDADLDAPDRFGPQGPGWREALAGAHLTPVPFPPFDALTVLPHGHDHSVNASTIGIAAIREALARHAVGHDIIIVATGSLRDSHATELLLSAADLAIAEVRRGDHRSAIAAHLGRIAQLPRHGGSLVFTSARPGDPGLLP